MGGALGVIRFCGLRAVARRDWRRAEECATSTYLVFPYEGAYVRHVGQAATVAEANQVLLFNEDEPYRVSHPVTGGDASLSIRLSVPALLELAPVGYLQGGSRTAFNRAQLRIDAPTQAL